MHRRHQALLSATFLLGGVAALNCRGPKPVLLKDIGPRLVSNQTRSPLALIGDGFAPGLQVRLGSPFSRVLPAEVVDTHHGYLRLPADLDLPGPSADADVTVQVVGGSGQAKLTVVNDKSFVEPTGLVLSDDERRAFTLSPTTDELVIIELDKRVELEGDQVQRLPVGDGPSALATWHDGKGAAWLVIGQRFAAHLLLVGEQGFSRRELDAPLGVVGLIVADNVAYLADEVGDEVTALDLVSGRRLWQTKVAPNPRAMAVSGSWLAVGSLETGEVSWIDRPTGKLVRRTTAERDIPIIGGTSEPYAKYVMGGKAVRDLQVGANTGKLWLASIGPNIGPNPEHWEISMNSGITVVDGESGLFERHLGLGEGMLTSLVDDAVREVVYGTDVATGELRIFDRQFLLTPKALGRALIQSLPLPVPDGFPLARAAGDYGHDHRTGTEMHSGPTAMVLGRQGRLFVLNRFTGRVAIVDVSQASRGQARVLKQISVFNTLDQVERRLGEILFSADMARTGITCEACHADGHSEGVLFTKTRPMRIYRVPTMRGVRDTPPYFVPTSTHSLTETSRFVGDRNRYHRPDLTVHEIDALSVYCAALAPLPNPFVGEHGEPPVRLTLPSGASASPRQGLAIFADRCSSCHPPPLFTTDQDAATRGRFFDVGTPHVLGLHPEWQESLYQGFPPPSLLGVWDVFPLLNTGSAGFAVQGDRLKVSSDWPIAEVLSKYSDKRHGDAGELSESERNDLWAYLLTL